MRLRRVVLPALCGALCGVTAWTAAGRLAVDTLAGAPQAIGLLPSTIWLGAAIVIGTVVALWAVFRGVPAGLFLLPALGLAGWTMVTTWPAIVAWAGPAIVIPFALLAVGVAITRVARHGSPDDRRPPSIRDRVIDRWGSGVAALLTASWIGVLLFALTPLWTSGDEPHYLVATQSLLADGDFDLKNEYDSLGYQSFYPGDLEPRHVAIGRLGQEFPFHGLGVSILVAPAFALAGMPGARVMMVLVAAIGAGCFWSAARRLTGSTSAAWIAWIALVSSAPVALHGVLLYPDGVGAAVTSIALWALVILVRHSTISVSAITVAGLALSMLPWLHIRLSAIAGVFGVAMLVALYRARRDLILPFMAAPIVSFVLWIASTRVMFGTLDPTRVFRQLAAGSLAAMPTGVLGMLFDAEYGLLVYAPVMALAALGIHATWRRSPLIAGASVLLTLSTLGVGGAWVWWGGDSAPARFLTPVVPLICLWLAAWWVDATRAARSFAGATLVVGACLPAAIAVAERGMYITNFPDGRGTIFDWLSPNVELTAGLPSLFRPGATPGSEPIVAGWWVLAGALAFAATVAWQRWRGDDLRHSWLVASASVLAWLTVGVTCGWWAHRATPWMPDRGQLRLLYAATSPAFEVAVRAPAPRIVSREDALSSLRIAMPLDDATTALHVPFVPAGRYAVSVETPSDQAAPPGSTETRDMRVPMLSLELGRDVLPFATWPAHDGSRAPAFSLAAPVYTVRVVVTQGAKDEAGVVRLRPHAVTAPIGISEVARRVTRYGGLVVYSFDPHSYPEADGFWMAADRTGRIVIADLDGRMATASMTVTAHDAPTTITISRGTFNRTLTLAPHAAERIVVPSKPADALVWFTVASASSLRAGDGRRLGALVRVSRE